MVDDPQNPVLEPAASRWDAEPDDGRASLALAGGLVAAVVGGLIWAAIVLFASLEIGWAAWGVGALVGAAMGRITVQRSHGLGFAAAGLAVAGLLLGKLAISLGSVGAITDRMLQEPGYLEGAVAWQMYDAGGLDDATREGVETTIANGDTLSDALWADMLHQAETRLAGMSDEERRESARVAASGFVNQLGITGAIMAQLSAWDLLWFGLALVTAYRMLARGKAEEAPVVA